jgi:hypothetical protein
VAVSIVNVRFLGKIKNSIIYSRIKILSSVLLVMMLASCDLCSNDVIKELISPDGKFIATSFERNCGATTPYYRIVSLRRAPSPFNPNKKDDWVFVIKEQPDILISWSSADALSISYSGYGEEPRFLVDSWNNIKVIHK